MNDPYFSHGPTLENGATSVILITPDDNADLPKVCKALRIWNPNPTPAVIRITPKDGGTVDLTVPANSLWTEPTITTKVSLTGTTAGLIIHGYSD
jgi:hypothetical protein